MSLETQIITLVILIILSAFFSGIETALMSLNMIKVHALVRQKKRGSETLQKIKQNPHNLIITILIGNNLVNIGAASLATVMFTDLFGSKGVGVATGVMTFLVLVFGEITPKTFAIQNAKRISLLAARPIQIISYVLSPITWIFELISKVMTRLLGSKEESRISEEELKTIVTLGVKEGLIDKEAAEMMHNILEFEDTKITSIMTPKASMEMIDSNAKLKDILNFIVKSRYSKFPVFAGTRDEIIGILDVDDVLKYVKDNKLGSKVKKLARPVIFVPEAKKIDDLLSEFEGKSIPLAIVVDEYGDVVGLVSVEDILEEIVGDIFDKSRKANIYITRISKNMIKADGRAPVEEINKVLHLGLEEKQSNTIAGFIQRKIQKIPEKGEKITLKNAEIEIEDVTKQGIKSVMITKL